MGRQLLLDGAGQGKDALFQDAGLLAYDREQALAVIENAAVPIHLLLQGHALLHQFGVGGVGVDLPQRLPAILDPAGESRPAGDRSA